MKSYQLRAAPELLNELAKDIAVWAAGKGFWKVPEELDCVSAPTRAWIILLMKSQKNALFTTEVAEHLEALRKPQVPSTLPGFTAEEEEIADTMIRLLDYAGYYHLRIGEALCAKMAKNEGRPYMHGKEF